MVEMLAVLAALALLVGIGALLARRRQSVLTDL
jgi:LPXTG-motif cell wall-anchored protein